MVRRKKQVRVGGTREIKEENGRVANCQNTNKQRKQYEWFASHTFYPRSPSQRKETIQTYLVSFRIMPGLSMGEEQQLSKTQNQSAM